MSSSVQATFSHSNFQLITNALADYVKLTGIDLTKNPFAEKIELLNSPEAILELLQEREKAFKEYREVNRRLISCLSPAVKVLRAFSGIIGEVVSLVSVIFFTYSLVKVQHNFVRSPSRQETPYSRALMFSSMYAPWACSSIKSPLTQDCARLPLGFPRVMTLCSNFLNAWGISSSVLRYM